VTIHEFGKENEKVILLIHPSVVKWDYFEYVIPLLEMAGSCVSGVVTRAET
jgi:hypothetical protein